MPDHTRLYRGQPIATNRASQEADRAGARIGRYVILELVGRGGMGVVYAAYDPQLDRRVALKVLRDRDRERTDDVARLLREARAIARVSHPNVISVFDVDSAGDVMFIAMEFVEGPTLHRWLKQTRRTPAEVIAIFREAGRGLAAAHDAGIVHRDFKPANVIVAGGRHARVLDFGLARADRSTTSLEPHSASVSLREEVLAHEPGSHDLLSTSLTRAGVVVGTPMYMAPEQHGGVVANARTDQYAFCVALYRALFGKPPFTADDLMTMVVEKRMGRIHPPPANVHVPRHVTSAVLRGLAVDPEQRWPDMRALLDVLGRDAAAGHRRWLGVAATAAAAALTAGAAVYAGARLESPCRNAEQRLAGVWDDERRGAIAHQLGALDVAYAQDALVHLERGLDEYAAQWSGMYVDACEATHVRKAQSDALLDRRMACLEQRRTALRALVDVLGSADAKVTSRAQEAVAGLPQIDACGDNDALITEVTPPDAEERDSVEEVRARLAETVALSAAGRYEDALATGRDAWTQAERVGYPPLHAEALVELGAVERAFGDHAAAEAHLVDALLIATANRHDRISAEAATELAAVVGVRLARGREGLRWVAIARSLYQRLGVEGLAIAGLDLNEGAVHESMGELELAKAAYERAVAERKDARGPDDPIAALWSINLANVSFMQARYADALAAFEAAAASTERAWGPKHPNNVLVAVGRATVLTALGRFDESETQLVHALEVGRESLPPDHLWVAGATCNLGLVQERRGDRDAALATFERCRAGNLRIMGREHPEYARALENLGRVQRDLGRLDEARVSLDEGYALRRRLLGDDSGETTWAALELADLDRVAGELSTAKRRYLEIIAAFERDDGDEMGRARARFGLARVRWELEGPSAEVRELAEAARAALATDPDQAHHLRVADAWLADHAAKR